MRTLDKIFNTNAQPSVTLNPLEATVAVGILMMMVDEEVTVYELDDLRNSLLELNVDGVDFNEMHAKAVSVLRQEGEAALFQAAKQALSGEAAEKAFIVAVKVALADYQVRDEEDEALTQLAQALGIPQNRMGALMDRVLDAV
ncbi:MAG: tellurite resistance TerB family protein [Oscillatoriales cyanobacterium SM2_1_8]|nr:tellurite resistance TerB family protein [Oscillatoriales cyanobacterium SM2_1_8]